MNLKTFLSYKKVNVSNKIWAGNFVCIDRTCTNMFKMQINSPLSLDKAEFGELVVKYVHSYSHERTIEKSLRCHGVKRATQTNKLIIDGVTNTRNSNIIENNRLSIKGTYP